MTDDMDCHLHHHLLEVLLDAAEADHPICIATEECDDLPAFLFGTEREHMYIDEIGWTDPEDGKLKGLCEDHKDDVYALHRIPHMNSTTNMERKLAMKCLANYHATIS